MTIPTPRKSIAPLVKTAYRPDVAAARAMLEIRLSVNEGALGPSPKALAAIKKAGGESLQRYPEQVSAALTRAIAEVHDLDLDPAMILPANGSDELIGLLATAYLDPGKGDEAIYTQYGFLVFPQAIRIAGGEPVRVDDDEEMTVSVDGILDAITGRTRLIFLANPNNPTGTMIDAGEVARLVAGARDDIVIVLDSAYAEFVTDAGYTDGAELVEAHPNVVMLRTFSKIHGLAGLRLGWGYMQKPVFDVLAAIRGPFSVNAAAASAGAAAIEDRDFVARSVAHNAEWRERMRESIRQAGFETLPGVANFFLIRFADAAAADAAREYLRARGISLRGMRPYGLADCLRMSIGTEAEMLAVEAAFKDLAAHLDKGGRS